MFLPELHINKFRRPNIVILNRNSLLDNQEYLNISSQYIVNVSPRIDYSKVLFGLYNWVSGRSRTHLEHGKTSSDRSKAFDNNQLFEARVFFEVQ